jgi:hypothetical protein
MMRSDEHVELRKRMNDDRCRRFGTPGRTVALLCECGDPTCHETVLLSADEYESRRPGLILHASHAGASADQDLASFQSSPAPTSTARGGSSG